MSNDVYRINGPRVIYEIIDGELILVHMEKGSYYSTDEVGAEIWSLIESGCSAAGMCAVLRSRYDADAAFFEQSVAAFLARLTDEELVAVEPSTAEWSAPAPAPSGNRRPFQAPMLNSYRDMTDMLALDPIHDVEAAGWPVPRTDDEPAAAHNRTS